MPVLLPQVVLVEWADASTENLEPRLRAKQLPAFDAAARFGAWTRLTPPSTDTRWPWPADFEKFRAIERGILVRGWNMPDDERGRAHVAPGEIDERVLSFFPPLGDALTSELRTSLASLYSTHNALADAAAQEVPPAFLAGRYDLIGPITRLYARSPHLPQALLAAYRLLDLLLADLNALREQAGAIAICARPEGTRSGFICFFSAAMKRDEMPKLGRIALMSDLLLASLDARRALPFASNAAWLQPEIVPAQWTAAKRVLSSTRDTGKMKTRKASNEERERLATLFPSTSWLASDTIFVLLAADDTTIHGAAGLGADGGLSLDFATSFPFDHDAAAPLFETIRAQAHETGVAEIFLRHPIAVDGGLHRALLRSGFETGGEQTLWLATVPAMLERARRLAGRAGEVFHVRPLAEEDIAFWRHRPEGRQLLRPQVRFDPDLSSVAFRGDDPAGILIAQRLGGRAWVDVMCIARDARLIGCFVPMAIQALTAGIAAGTLEVVFVTGEDSRLAAAFARRCGASVLQQGVRLRAVARE